jgi:uncharacterized delta-60 repeat protein
LGSVNEDWGQSVAVDSSGNVYVCGYDFDSGSGVLRFIIAKYNTSGIIQWQRRLGGDTGTSNDSGYSVAVDASGNVYVCGQSNPSNRYSAQIVKYDTSGTLQWQRRLGPSVAGNSAYALSLAVDSSGNIYFCGVATISGNQDFLIAKYDTSGVIQWQRRLGSSASDIGRSVAVDSSGNVYVCGQSEGSSNLDFLVAKLPGDGSLTGTYTVGGVSIAYTTSSLTDEITSLGNAASSLTDAASSLTDAATSLTDAASSLTSSVTTI